MKYIIFNKFVNNKTIQICLCTTGSITSDSFETRRPYRDAATFLRRLVQVPHTFRAAVGSWASIIVDINCAIVIHVRHHE